MLTILFASAGALTHAPAAHAEWKGLATFDCETSRANWNFDGLYGPYTTRAVKNLQRVRGIKVDGVTGPETCKVLGLRYRRTLRCGMGGNDVYILQQALAASGFWYGGLGDTLAEDGLLSQTPWMEPPLFTTPEPVSTPAPITLLPAEPQPTPPETPAPEVFPSQAPVSAQTPAPPPPFQTPQPAWTPAFEMQAGNWMVPLTAGATSYDWTFSRPTWNGQATAWFGDYGVGAEVTNFNVTYVNYRDPAVGAYFVPNTAMYDLNARWRFEQGAYQITAGYRGLGQANVNFASLGGVWDRALWGGWLWSRVSGQLGHNLQDSYFLDGRAVLSLRLDPLVAEVGFRHFTYQNRSDQPFHLNGPVIGAGIAF
ncbi:MAG: peptidoglycan-binding domain-containing protein [Candidatus Sericytochromatia bacterium]|nr:peptidoglycan-binding domain-containing protein [Candidatus Sericytochromatia bacterium]